MTGLAELDYRREPWALAYMLRGVAPVARRFDRQPAIVARWRGHRADRRQLELFLRSSGLGADPHLPLLYAHTFGFRVAMAVLTHPAFPVPIWGVLQTRNHLVEHTPIERDARLDFETRVASGRVLDKGAEFDLHTTVTVKDQLAWESLVTFFVRGRFGQAESVSPLAAAPTDVGPLLAGWRMSDEAHWQFCRFTGDYNGIHVWDRYARKLGFPRALYHPPRVLGHCLSRLAPAGGPRPTRLDAWLKGPVLHGASVRLFARETSAGTTFQLRASEERPSIVGRLSHAPAARSLLNDLNPEVS